MLLAFIIGLVVCATVAFMLLNLSEGPPRTAVDSTQQLIADPLNFISNRFQGGIGVVLTISSTNRAPVIMHVIRESPAEAAGLLVGDLILEIEGGPAHGLTSVQTVEKIRGWTVAGVDLVVRRNGTNLNVRVSRASWQNLMNAPANTSPQKK